MRPTAAPYHFPYAHRTQAEVTILADINAAIDTAQAQGKHLYGMRLRMSVGSQHALAACIQGSKSRPTSYRGVRIETADIDGWMLLCDLKGAGRFDSDSLAEIVVKDGVRVPGGRKP